MKLASQNYENYTKCIYKLVQSSYIDLLPMLPENSFRQVYIIDMLSMYFTVS